jgi:hypothetical protein
VRHLLLPTAVLMLAAAALPAGQAQAPRLEDVLRAAADYLAGYERTLALVAQEEYTQQVNLVAVTFGLDAGVGMWVPLSMEEQYRGNFNGLVTGLAKYSHYRQFKVETSTEIR